MGYWPKESLFEELLRLDSLDIFLAPDYIAINDPPLHHEALMHFPHWGDTLKAAGLDYESELKARLVRPV